MLNVLEKKVKQDEYRSKHDRTVSRTLVDSRWNYSVDNISLVKKKTYIYMRLAIKIILYETPHSERCRIKSTKLGSRNIREITWAHYSVSRLCLVQVLFDC